MTTPGLSGQPSASDSPSLIARRDPARRAFEMKFLLDEARAAELRMWARDRLTLDPHGDAALDGAYHITSLYLDTPAMDVYRRTPGYTRRKYRVRRYGALPWVFLERKSRRGDRVSKRRTSVPLEELARLAQPTLINRLDPPAQLNGAASNGHAATEWPGEWFRRQTATRGLLPACGIAYERTAFFASVNEGPVRLTFDRDMRGTPANGWLLNDQAGQTPVPSMARAGADAGAAGGTDGTVVARPLLQGRVIVEMKFLDAVPHLFREALTRFRLSPTPVSKYRLCRDAWGGVSSAFEVPRA